MRFPLIALAAFAALPAVAQEGSAVDDCEFLRQSFAGVYEGLRAMAGGDVEQADPATVTMFTAIQTNIILLAQAAECDMAPLIAEAREQLGRYAPEAGALEE